MTGRVLAIIKDYGNWETMDDVHQIYNTIIANGFDTDDVCDETLKRLVNSLTKENGEYVYDMFARLNN
jgi:hypothetical protein